EPAAGHAGQHLFLASAGGRVQQCWHDERDRRHCRRRPDGVLKGEREMEDVLARHERIALQFSGGKDSLALLYLMRPFWDRLTVYWLDTGDAFPETAALVAEVEAMVPHFVTVHGIQPEVIAEFGLPSDLVPARSTPVGIAATGTGILIQDRYSCCLRSLMLPLHGRMRAD